jgi:hypothetical protein
MNPPEGLIVLARGEADQPQRALFAASALALVRYADPAAWVTATAIAQALAPVQEVVATQHEHAGVIVTSAEGPVETMATVAEAARAGFASPLRYPAANPGSLTGVACLLFGLRGPSLNLTLPAATGVPVGLLLAGRWLQTPAVPFVILAACSPGTTARYLTRCLLLAGQGSPCSPMAGELSAEAAWLLDLPPESAEEGT